MFIGDGEDGILEMCDTLLKCKEKKLSREETKKRLSNIESLWVPEYHKPVKRRVFKDFANSKPPVKQVIPNVIAVHNRAPLEILRGCVNGCRFCNAGYYYRPKRERPPEKLIAYAHEMLENTGEESLGLLSLSTSDYTKLPQLISGLDNTKLYPEQTVSIPSMRMNDKTISLLDSSSKIRRSLLRKPIMLTTSVPILSISP